MFMYSEPLNSTFIHYNIQKKSGQEHNLGQFRFRRAVFYSQLKSKVTNILTNVTTLLNIDVVPLTLHGRTHPSH